MIRGGSLLVGHLRRHFFVLSNFRVFVILIVYQSQELQTRSNHETLKSRKGERRTCERSWGVHQSPRFWRSFECSVHVVGCQPVSIWSNWPSSSMQKAYKTRNLANSANLVNFFRCPHASSTTCSTLRRHKRIEVGQLCQPGQIQKPEQKPAKQGTPPTWSTFF